MQKEYEKTMTAYNKKPAEGKADEEEEFDKSRSKVNDEEEGSDEVHEMLHCCRPWWRPEASTCYDIASKQGPVSGSLLMYLVSTPVWAMVFLHRGSIVRDA